MVPSKAEYSKAKGVLHVVGKLDFAEEEGLREMGKALLSEGKGKVVLDLAKVTYISSSCLGELLVLDEEAKKLGLKLTVRVPRALLYVYDLMGIRSVVDTEIVED
ncbi:MAG: STAS domain-containing protein [Planctomycetes bacterium]|nr:STAS domain-containing protein [Planctomycetota bacterium]